MNEIQSLNDVERVLSSMGFEAKLNENNVFVKVGGKDSPFPCVIVLDEDNLTVSCEIATWGSMTDRITPDMKDDFFLSILDLNSQTLPYAFSVLTDVDGEDDDRSNWPVVLIDSMPVGDISEEELLASMRSLNAALMTAKNLFDVSLVESL
jgi:hypothetical protein